MSITEWPVEERPRERLLRQGAATLSDAELLAIFLRVGVEGKNAVELARDVLARFDHRLHRLAGASLADLTRIKGLGTAKAAQLLACFELAKRALSEKVEELDLLSSPQAVRDWLRLQFGGLKHEVFAVLWLDTRNRLLHWEELFRGSLTQTSVYPREIVRRALELNAAAVILAHNHPSGVAEPSSADRLLTHSLREALQHIDVRVLDHFIVAGNAPPLSMAELGLL